MAELTKFKGWAIPGPRPQSAGLDPGSPSAFSGLKELEIDGQAVTVDSISGYYKIHQYRDGHRFSTDDVLVAWYGTTNCPRADRVLDLGSGIGTVAMISAWRLPGARFTTIEAQEISIRLARESVRLNGLSDRFDLRLSDFRAPEVLRPDELFDLVTGSPPYFPLGTGVLGEHPQKVACRFEVRGDIADYCAVASAHLAPGGVFAGVFPWVQWDRVEAGAEAAGLRLIREREVVLREGETPLLGLFLMMRKDHLPETVRGREWRSWREPPLVIRSSDGSVHPEYVAVKLSFGFPP